MRFAVPPTRASARPEAKLSEILGVCLVSGLASQAFLLNPVFLGALAESRGYGPADLGFIAAAGGAGGLVAALSSPIWLPKAPARRTAAGLVALALLALLSMIYLTRSPVAAMLNMALHGLAMGALYTLTYRVVSLFARPEKTLSWKLGTEAFPGLALLYIVATLVAPTHGFVGVIIAMACSSLILGTAVFLLPAAKPRRATWRPPAAGTAAGLWLAVGATFLHWTSVNAVWTFMERIGVGRSIPLATIGAVLTLGWLFASLGSFAAEGVSIFVGRIIPFLLGSVLALAGMLIGLDPSPLGYAIGAVLFLMGMSFAVIFPIASIVALSPTPGFAGVVVVALQAAGVAGPAVSGLLYQTGGEARVVAFASACLFASVGLYLAAAARRVGRGAFVARSRDAPAEPAADLIGSAAPPPPGASGQIDPAAAWPPTIWRPFSSGIAD